MISDAVGRVLSVCILHILLCYKFVSFQHSQHDKMTLLLLFNLSFYKEGKGNSNKL